MDERLSGMAEDIYRKLSPHFEAAHKSSIDLQSDFAERLEIVLTLAGEKPSFFAFISEPARAQLFDAIGLELTSAGYDAFHGIADVNVHVPHRSLKLELRNGPRSETLTGRQTEVFWLTAYPALASTYERNEFASEGESRMLGYPTCCASWHYDVYIARPIEAIAAVYRDHAPPGKLEASIKELGAAPGVLFPQQLFAARLFESNAAYPYIAHAACPTCMNDRENSPSAKQNNVGSAPGVKVDPVRHREVEIDTRNAFRRSASITANPLILLENEANDLQLSGTSRTVYLTRGRHWLKAMGLK